MTTANTFGLRHLTPVLVVDEVEPCLRFWTDRLGFTAENQVPGDDGKLVFASVKAGDVEVMYQTRASVLAEQPEAADEFVGHSTVLFIMAFLVVTFFAAIPLPETEGRPLD